MIYVVQMFYVFKQHFGTDSNYYFVLLKMISQSRSTLSDIKIGESALEDIMLRAYEKFDIQLSSIQLLYSKFCKYPY